MATVSIGTTITGFNPSYMPSLSDTADIQVALKALYFGSTGAAANTDGIYGALNTLYNGNPSIGTTTGTISINSAIFSLPNATTFNINGSSPAIVTSQTTGSAAIFNTNIPTINIGGAATTISLGASTGTTTVNNGLVIAAGTASKAPLKITSSAGTKIGYPSWISGAFEYDGKVAYFTPNNTQGQGVMATNYFYCLSADSTSFSTSKNIFGGTSGYFQLAASTLYEIEMFLYIFYSASAPTVTPGLTITWGQVPSSQLTVLEWSPGAAGAWSSYYSTSTGTMNFSAVGSGAGSGGSQSIIRVKTIIRTSANDTTFTPTITLSGGSSPTGKIGANSYVRITPLGSSTATSSGYFA